MSLPSGADYFFTHWLQGFILDTCLDLNFWRFDLRFELNREARNIAYWVELPGSVRQSIFVNQWQFTIPGAVQKWRWTAYSCSGYSSSVDRTKWGGDDHPMFQVCYFLRFSAATRESVATIYS